MVELDHKVVSIPGRRIPATLTLSTSIAPLLEAPAQVCHVHIGQQRSGFAWACVADHSSTSSKRTVLERGHERGSLILDIIEQLGNGVAGEPLVDVVVM